jgi:maltose alpha-D-glucosyltransferase/alpha-amylase
MPLSIADIGGDASNTSLAVSYSGGLAVIVKLVRRCRAGVHPEVEVGRFLSESPVRADVPKLLGWLDYVPSERAGDAGPATVAIVHERVDAQGSAWEVMMASATADWPRCLSLAASLGQTTARLHAALASRDDDPAFAPEPWTADAWAAAVRSMELHATRVLDHLEQLRETPPACLAAHLAAVASDRSRIMAGFAEQATMPPSTHRIRVHGDYHLGQVLVGRGDDRCVVIDFEGEPARSLSERREKTSAAKDVAGMCRSFDYLLRVLAKDGRRPYTVGDLAILESTFLSAYETTSHSLAAQRPEARWWPEDRRETDRLLAVYKLDKALYEVAYEADHRPDWLEVPLAAIAARDFGGM